MGARQDTVAVPASFRQTWGESRSGFGRIFRGIWTGGGYGSRRRKPRRRLIRLQTPARVGLSAAPHTQGCDFVTNLNLPHQAAQPRPEPQPRSEDQVTFTTVDRQAP